MQFVHREKLVTLEVLYVCSKEKCLSEINSVEVNLTGNIFDRNKQRRTKLKR